MYTIVCSSCGTTFAEEKTYTRCLKCKGALDAAYDYDKIAKKIKRKDIVHKLLSHQKYVDFFPLNHPEKMISLHEGGTPLVELKALGKKFGLSNLLLKNEAINPTGVFKDRGTAVEISKAIEMKAKAIVVASSGNMAASCAAYSAKAKLPCYILVPSTTPIEKVTQALVYGGHVIKINAGYTDCIHLASLISEHFGLYLAGDYVFRREGQKSLSYELIEQLEAVPDVVICPVGAGTHLAGVWKGFLEYYEMGLVDKLPRIIGVQAAGCAPITEAFEKRQRKAKIWKNPDTICSAVNAMDPPDDTILLGGIYRSKGAMVSVSDEKTLEHQLLLGNKEGIFCEISSALAISALPHLVKKKLIKKNETIVTILTGIGLKDPKVPLAWLPVPTVLEPKFEQIRNYLNKHLK